MNKKNEYFESILNEIECIENDQLMTEEKYIELYGKPEDYDDVASMHYYFQDIEINLPSRFSSLYYKISYFFEMQGEVEFLKMFNESFKSRMFHIDSIKETKEHPYYDISIPILIEDIRLMFVSLRIFFQEVESGDSTQIDILERVLRNLDFKLKGIDVSKEKDFFDELIKIIRLIFPTCQLNPKAQYISKLKTYIPDIFVPDCKSILELKYVDSLQKLKECMEQIDTDEKGYVGNPKYIHYYAVFYFTEKFVSDDELKTMWEERNHPNAWKFFPVYKLSNIQ